MDFKLTKRLTAIWSSVILGFVILMLPIHSAAEFNRIKNFSFDDCDPFQARARIMEINGKAAQLVAAEQIIYVVDLQLGTQHLITELTDSDGDPMDFGSLRRGQWIYVKGFKHIEGGVVASLIQRIDPPDRQKPVVRKISKESRRTKQFKRRLRTRTN